MHADVTERLDFRPTEEIKSQYNWYKAFCEQEEVLAHVSKENDNLRTVVSNLQTACASALQELDEVKKQNSKEGQSKRQLEYFAATALNGMLACPVEFQDAGSITGRVALALRHAKELQKQLEAQ